MSDDGESGGDYDLEGYESEDSLEPDPYSDNGGLFELEALESASDSDNGAPDSDVLSPTPSSGFGDPSSFPQFMQLPPEIRHEIWRLFCPDLVAKSRVFEFTISRSDGQGWIKMPINAGNFLDQQTAALRAVLATHRESRALALRTLPDTLAFGDSYDVLRFNLRFNKERDIIRLSESPGVFPESARTCGFTHHIRHLALDAEFSEMPDPALRTYLGGLLRRYPNLEAVYLHVEARDCELAEMPWLKADKLNIYHFQTYEEYHGIGEDLDFVYCWPDPGGGAVPIAEYDFPAENHASGHDSKPGSDHGSGSGSGDELTASRRLPLFPLVEFELESGMDMFNRLMEWRRSGGELDLDWDSSSDSDSEPNEYESEGINDEDIEEDSQQASDEEDDLAVLDHSEDESDGGGGVVAVAGHISISSSDNDSDSDSGDSDGGVEHLLDHEDHPFATFSSPEAGPGSSSTMEGDAASESSSSEESPVRMVSRPKRRIVSSDAEDDSDDEPASRPSKRARIVLSDSEEEEKEEDDD
jgi:hypothetical protein